MSIGRPATVRQRMLPAPPLPPVEPDPVLLPPGGTVPAGRPPAVAAGAVTALARAHQAHLLALADLHKQFITQQGTAAARILPLFGRGQPHRSSPGPAPITAGPSPTIRPQGPPLPGPALPGPTFTRAQLEELATMRRSVSSLFGPQFARQDTHRYQLRVPAPPMLFTDRVLGIEGTPGSLGGGRLWAEVDLTRDMFGLDPAGRISGFLLGEAGQANMLLASWLGADLSHDGQSRYRMLDLDLTIHGALPAAGETLRTEITLERHAVAAGLCVFFFGAEQTVGGRLFARARFSAGLFTETDLAQPTEVNWKLPPAAAPAADEPFEGADEFTHARSFGRAAMAALREGRIADCFGGTHRRARTHVRTPRAALPELFLLDSVEAFEPRGGPGGLGYLRVTQAVTPDDWYFAAHLPGDPCMPGFLMLEAAKQSLAFYLTAMGLTLSRDGWRFEPPPGVTVACRFRGQVVPQTATIVYEAFVTSVSPGPVPAVVADVIGRLDGRIVFHARDVALRLIPDWPLEQFRSHPYAGALGGGTGPLPLLAGLAGRPPDPEAASVDGIETGYASVLALAWGKAEDVFGPRMAALDGPARWARLPAPPFLFVTRVTRIEAEAAVARPGSRIRTSWDIPERAWFFTENGTATMPFAVMLEALLQPPGWLMAFVGPLAPDGRPFTGHLRNLDGIATVHRELTLGTPRLEVTVELISMVQLGGTVLFTMQIAGCADDDLICEVRATYGMFSAHALREQVGVPATAGEHARIRSEGDRVIDLAATPDRYFSGTLRLPGPRLRMIDRVTALDPAGGAAGLGWARAEKPVDPEDWFFKAHFFQDPVQPGSLGLQMLLQLLQVVMIELDLGATAPRARFEPVATGRELTWKYRGQVLPENQRVVAEVELTETGRDDRGPFVIADGWLWVDGTRIYQVSGIGMRIVSDPG